MANKTAKSIFDSQEESYSFSPPPSLPPPGEGVRTNFRDLDPVWGRERERVNRDALTRLKPPRGVGGLVFQSFWFSGVGFIFN